jgi:hypothetical protein
MNGAANDLTAVLARLEKLERQNRWLKRVGALVLVFAGVGLVMGAQERPNGQRSEEAFSLRDANGKQRVWLGMGTEGPLFRFTDENGAEISSWMVTKGGMAFRFLNSKGGLRTGLSLEPAGVAMVSVDDRGRLVVGRNAVAADAGIFSTGRKPATVPSKP